MPRCLLGSILTAQLDSFLRDRLALPSRPLPAKLPPALARNTVVNRTVSVRHIHPEPPHGPRVAASPVVVEPDPAVPAQDPRGDAPHQAAEAAARVVDLRVLAAAGGGEGPVDVGGGDVVRVLVTVLRAVPGRTVCGRRR